jgi:hypothetical protein
MRYDMKRSELYKIRAMIEKAAVSLADDDAIEAAELFPAWAVGTAYSADQRIRYGDKLYRCVQAHTSQADWKPDSTPALWTEVAKPGEIPVWKQPTGAQDAYAKGDKVWFPDVNTTVYESIIDSNVWSPTDYPQGWKAVD